MKAQFFIIGISFLLNTANVIFPTISIERPSNLLEKSPEELFLDRCLSPIEFTSGGISAFFKNVYNRPGYGDFLSLSLAHLEQFLAYRTKESTRDYPYSVLQLFMRPVKKTYCLDAYELDKLLVKLPALLGPYLSPIKNSTKSDLQDDCNALLFNKFLHDFESFKNHPDEFLKGLSASIDSLAQEHYDDQQSTISRPKLQSMIVRFLDTALNKVGWSIEESDKAWDSVKSIAEHLLALSQAGVITDTEDINDLLWTLLIRFGTFIDLASSRKIPPQFYTALEHDLAHDLPYFLKIEEQEEDIETKKSYLEWLITSGKAKAVASDFGIIT